MRVYSEEDAQQRLGMLLEQALSDGSVGIRRQDGEAFILSPDPTQTSPLDVIGIDTDITTAEIVASVRAGRER